MGSLQFYCRKRVRRRKGVNLNHILPDELVSDILSRLPLTSLPQLKLTCKLWKSLIVDDPSFPSKHLSHALKNPGHLYTLIDYPNFYFAEKQLDNTVAIGLPRQAENDDLGEDTLYLHKKAWLYKVEYASCHGLVCHFPTTTRRSVFVFNPIIKEHVQLPNRSLPAVLRWGFGFAPITHKYKCYCYSAGLVDRKTWLFSSALYTLGHNESWREISCAPYPEIFARKHVHSKGALYWALHNGEVNSLFPEVKFEPGTFNVLPLDLETEKFPKRPIDVVLSLDLETEKFRERRIHLDQGTQLIYLAVVGETVATVARLYNGLKVFFLIDEDKDIWEAKYTVPYRISIYSLRPERFYYFDLMGLWMNQELYFSERVLSSSSREIYDLRCFFFSPGDNKKFSPLHFPFPKDVHGEITPQLILPHVGGLVSPIIIMTAGKQLLNNPSP